jgi:hypothetical protein
MPPPPPRSTRPPSRLLAACLAAFATAPAFSTEPAAAAPEVPVLPGEITRSVIDQGDHRTILIEMVPDTAARPQRHRPATAAPTPTPTPAPLTAAAETTEADAKPEIFLDWRVTVYPGPVPCSVIEGETADHRPWRVISNVDLNLFRPCSTFTSARAVYDWFPCLIDGDLDSPNRPSPAALGLAAAPAAYRIAPASQNPGPDALDALTAIHAYHDAHHDALLADYIAREQAAAARERELREHPPEKPDTVVRFSNPDLLRSLQIPVAP